MENQFLNQRKKVETRIIEKAVKDEGFRNELKADPKTVLAKELGINIPAGITITVIEEEANSKHSSGLR